MAPSTPSTILCYLLLIVISSSPRSVLSADESVIKERSPLYERGYHQQAVGEPKDYQRNLAHVQPRAYRNNNNPYAASQDVDQLEPSGKPKSYAFAYAVKDGQNGDDFSHKERREGKKTVGEYSVLLPDGRTQVVKYTSDAKEGFKADVTYEGGSHDHLQAGGPTAAQPVYYQPASSAASSPQHQIGSPYPDADNGIYSHNGRLSPTVPAYRAGPSKLPRGPPPPSPSRNPNNNNVEEPIYLSYPLKAQRPSVSPSLFYKSGGGSIRQDRHQIVAATPSSVIYREAGGPGHYHQQGPSQATYLGPSQASYLEQSEAPYPGPSPKAYPAGLGPSPYPQGPSPSSYPRRPGPSPYPRGPSPSPYPIRGAGPSPYPGGPSPSPYPRGPSPASYPDGPSPSPYSFGPSPASYQAGPSPASYSPGPIVISKGAAPGPYRSNGSPAPQNYYPSPSPNSIYDRQVPQKFSASVQRVPKGGSHYSKSGSVPPTALSLASPYRSITRGERAGPLSTPVYNVKPSGPPPPPVRHSHAHFAHRGPSVSPYYAEQSQQVSEQYAHISGGRASHTQTNHKHLVPVNNFKAGPSGDGSLLEQQSVSQLYSPVGSTVSSPLASPQPHLYFGAQNAISAADQYSPANAREGISEEGAFVPLTQSEEIYLSQIQKQGIQISPVKSSVATYTSEYLGVTPKPDLFESTSNPGIPVGRPVQPSIGGLSYVDAGRGPRTNKHGVKEALSRLPSLNLPTTKTYEVGAPDFGSSVSYSDDDNNKKKAQDRPLYLRDFQSNQLHDGLLREYVVEKKLGVTPSYEDELA